MISNKCKVCGYRFKKDDGDLCPECLTARADRIGGNALNKSSDVYFDSDKYYNDDTHSKSMHQEMSKRNDSNQNPRPQVNRNSQPSTPRTIKPSTEPEYRKYRTTQSTQQNQKKKTSGLGGFIAILIIIIVTVSNAAPKLYDKVFNNDEPIEINSISVDESLSGVPFLTLEFTLDSDLEDDDSLDKYEIIARDFSGEEYYPIQGNNISDYYVRENTEIYFLIDESEEAEEIAVLKDGEEICWFDVSEYTV